MSIQNPPAKSGINSRDTGETHQSDVCGGCGEWVPEGADPMIMDRHICEPVARSEAKSRVVREGLWP